MVGRYYEVLGVAPQASGGEIRTAYLRLARERHPDRFPDPAERQKAEAFFKELTEAFNTLSNEQSRREYDASLEKPAPTSPEEIARLAYQRGVAAFEARQYHEAVELLRVAVHHQPAEARYQLALGRGLAKNPNWSREAIAALEEAARLSPTTAASHAELAKLFLSQGLKLRARRSAEAALRLAPDDPAIRQLAEQTGVGPEEPEPKTKGGLSGFLRRKS